MKNQVKLFFIACNSK